MRLRLVREPFDHSDYIFELKHDGFRAIAYLQNGESKLVSSNQRNLGFEVLKRSLAKLPVENAILDGEVIWVDAKGLSQFNQLLGRKGEPVFYAFDLLWLDFRSTRGICRRSSPSAPEQRHRPVYRKKPPFPSEKCGLSSRFEGSAKATNCLATSGCARTSRKASARACRRAWGSRPVGP